MNSQKIIIGIGILVGLFLLHKTKSRLLRVILIGLVVSFVMTFFVGQLFVDLSFFSFGILAIGFSIHQVVNKKWVGFVIGFFAFLLFIRSLMHWQFVYELRFFMLFPISIYVWTLINKRESNSELSILTILVFYELSEF